jgi:hypothetical protein
MCFMLCLASSVIKERHELISLKSCPVYKGLLRVEIAYLSHFLMMLFSLDCEC